MKEIGYKTFSPIIDKNYDEIYDHKSRLIAVCKEIKRLVSKVSKIGLIFAGICQ